MSTVRPWDDKRCLRQIHLLRNQLHLVILGKLIRDSYRSRIAGESLISERVYHCELESHSRSVLEVEPGYNFDRCAWRVLAGLIRNYRMPGSTRLHRVFPCQP